ncbi:MAG: PD-(D/E)XK nuclease family protein [Candidatus Tritonobacter lacicola]|nr:PD-(D/E)XK nuclease family protein [Candidatus Tritonobacter lacicola]
MEQMRLSYGKINTFENCPLKYKLAYVDQVPVEKKESSALNFYQSIHDTLETFHKMGTHPIPSLEQFRSIYDRHWKPGGYPDEATEQMEKKLGWGILEKFHGTFTDEKPDVKYLSQSIRWQITPDLTVSSRIDRIDRLEDGRFELINYKTGKNVPTEEELKSNLQAIILFRGANTHKRYLDNVAKVSFYFLRSNTKVSATPGKEEIKAAKTRIKEDASNILQLAEKNGIIHKTTEKIVEMFDTLISTRSVKKAAVNDSEALAEKGPLCSTCEYLVVCPAWPVKPHDLVADEPMDVYKQRIRMSYSKLSSYKKCPRAWKKSYIDHLGTGPRPFFSFGTAVHEAFEYFFDPDGKKKSSLRYLMKCWDKAFNNYQEGYKDKAEKKKYHEKGREMIERYYNKEIKGKYGPAFTIERYFEIPLGKNVVMTGFIDRIDKIGDNEYIILDYKTEPTDRPQEKVDHDDQLTIYFWACEEVLNLPIVKMGLIMLNFDKITWTTRKKEDIPAVVADIDAVAAEMKDNIRNYGEGEPEAESVYFPPKKNKYCKSCDYLNENPEKGTVACPLRDEVMGDTGIRSMEYD